MFIRTKMITTVLLIVGSVTVIAQKRTEINTNPAQPKLIVGMMVDQMRWDYLYKYSNRYTEGGFKRLLREGFSCENTHIDYSPTITACGHTSVYTGTTPAVHGIIGNDWYDRNSQKSIGCVNDKSVQLVGTVNAKTGQSPHNNLSSTITDQLRIATNFQSKTVGVAIKDRASILPAGHAATAAFWYDGDEGKFVTSTYYMDQLPEWATRFNQKKLIDDYYKNDWNTLFPIHTYTLSTADDKPYEGMANGEEKPVFPHKLSQFIGKNYGAVRTTPFGNTLTFAFAKAAVEGYNLGGGNVTDFLAVSFSSPDAIGHTYGTNSIEVEDNYLRLDRELADFFNYLDKKFGKGNYLYFLTADHGAVSAAGFHKENKIPAGVFESKKLSQILTKTLQEQLGLQNPVLALSNYQIYMNWEEIDSKGVTRQAVSAVVESTLLKQPGIAHVIPTREVVNAVLPEVEKKRLILGYNYKRSGDYFIVGEPNWYSGSSKGTSHSAWYGYDSHIPLVWMGWKIKPGHSNKPIGMTAIAPTLAALLHIQGPSGAIGLPITEITDK